MRIKDRSTPKPPAEEPKPQTSSLPAEAAAAVEAFKTTGATLALTEVPKALDGFLSQNPAELGALRDELKHSPQGQRELASHQADDLWKGRATADKVVKILAGGIQGAVPTTPKEAAALLSDSLGTTHTLYAERDALLAGKDPKALSAADQTKLQSLEAAIVQSEAHTDALRTVHHQLEGVKRLNPLEATGLMAGISIGTGVPGLGGGSFEVGTAVSPENRATDKRRIDPYASVGVGTAFVGGGYALSTDKSRSGPSFGFSVPFFGFSQDKQHGKRISAFIPNVASFQMTERGEVGFSFAIPVAPFVQVGFSLFVENPAIARITGPAVRGIEKVVGPPVRLIKRGISWVKEHVIHRHGEDAAKTAPAGAEPSPA